MEERRTIKKLEEIKDDKMDMDDEWKEEIA
jgi:hypothetical protein